MWNRWCPEEGGGTFRPKRTRSCRPGTHLGNFDERPWGFSVSGINATVAGSRPVVYIAGSREQAEFVARWSAELNALRADLGQQPVSVGVLVAGTDGADLRDRLPGAPGTLVFDLRAP